MAASLQARRFAQQYPDKFVALIGSGDLARRYSETEFISSLSMHLSGCDTREKLQQRLRQFRQREWLRIVWRDFCRLADTMETTRDLSLLAEACIELGLKFLHRELVADQGEPRSANGETQQLCVIAMGKLGARELNLSSDIDLIFTYAEAGKTDGSGLSNQEFFTRLGQRLIAALDQVTVDGFVFRVDMRLRPYGQSGAVVVNFAALEEYYQDQGRDWERYAMLKGRVITGPERHRQLLAESLQPFVYRRYIDFGVIESLRDMKRMIGAEARRRGLQEDVKLGPGGIREVEFIAQCFQLIRGGRSPALQQRELLAALDACEQEGCLPSAAVAELKTAYLFLRNVEHAIQGYDDRQSQQLPTGEVECAALLVAMDFTDWDDFLSALNGHRQRVSFHFSALIAEPEENSSDRVEISLWPETLDADSLAQTGFPDAERLAGKLHEFKESRRVRHLQTESCQRLDQFMPRLFAACLESQRPDLALLRVLPLVQAVTRRSAYLVLLIENPAALAELIALCAASPWISEQLTGNPVLLDELLDTTSLYSTPDKQALASALRQQVSRLPADDLERHMEALRYFKASQQLHVAASEVTGRLPLMEVSDKLTFLAEVILEQALMLAWRELTEKHGVPDRDDGGLGFAIIGYGKLGGIELGHSSDLDLVFIYDASMQGRTGGERALDHSVFYTRLGQKIIHILNTRTAMGQLYEIDMRLRPSGNSGMLVASLKAYRDYQLSSAWTWEHQALVRARYITGDPTLAEQFDELRQQVLMQARNESSLAVEVVEMRDRMREHILSGDKSTGHEFDLKQGRGGIVDIEFMVQYAVLAWAAQVPQLCEWSDNVRILDALRAANLFTAEEAKSLADAYLNYRSAAHQLALQQSEGVVAGDQYASQRAAVSGKWKSLFSRPRDSA